MVQNDMLTQRGLSLIIGIVTEKTNGGYITGFLCISTSYERLTILKDLKILCPNKDPNPGEKAIKVGIPTELV